jgi:hypothetical protein
MKWICVTLGMLIGAACLAKAAPLDQDDHSRTQRPPTTNPQSGLADAQDMRRRLLAGATPTAEQIKKAEDFLQTYSRHRYQAYKELIAERPRPGIQRAMVNGYIELYLLQYQDSELYQMKLDELALEDQIFGMITDARNSPEKVDQQQLHDDLRPVFQKLIDKRKQESNRRIKRMQDAVDNEKKRLDKLQTIDEARLDERIDQEIASGSRLPLGIVGGGPNSRDLQGGPDRGPTSRSVNADKLPLPAK